MPSGADRYRKPFGLSLRDRLLIGRCDDFDEAKCRISAFPLNHAKARQLLAGVRGLPNPASRIARSSLMLMMVARQTAFAPRAGFTIFASATVTCSHASGARGASRRGGPVNVQSHRTEVTSGACSQELFVGQIYDWQTVVVKKLRRPSAAVE